MNKELLLDMIGQRMSTYKIAKIVGKSQTTVRYWIRKYKISLNDSKENRSCICCENLLTASQVKFCSIKCKSRSHYEAHKLNPNTTYSQFKRAHVRKLQLLARHGNKCSQCGYYKNLSALHFHHLRDKIFNIDSRRIANTTMIRLIEESDKCIILCANCHAEEHNPHFDIKLLLSGLDQDRTDDSLVMSKKP